MSATPSLSAEARVLLLSAGGPENDPALRALLRRGVLWPRLARLAARENALAVLMRRLDAAAPDVLPPSVRAEWQPLARVAEFRLAWLDERLSQTLAALHAGGIGGVLLKGAALARTVYPSFVQRPMGDLDLLVPASEAARAHALLRAAGWKPEAADGDGGGYDGHHHLAPLVDARGTGVALELHTALFPDGHPFALSADDIRAEAVDAGTRGTVPSTRHMALHLCLHFAWSHQAEAGAWRTFRDLHTLAPTLDWDAFAQAARDSRGASACWWTLRLARAASGLAVPEAVMAALRPPVGARTLALLERHFLAQLLPSARACPSVRLRRAAWERAMQPAHAGHGAVRPWMLDRAPAPASAPAASLGVVPRGARALGRWGRYAGALLGRPGRAPSDPPLDGDVPVFTASPGAAKGSRLLPPGFRRARLGSTPTVSIVMASMRDGDALRDALRDLVPHCREREAELVIALPAAWDGADALRAEYPPARFVVSAGARTAGELRAAGMAEASGDIVTLTDEAGALPAAWLAVVAPVEA